VQLQHPLDRLDHPVTPRFDIAQKYGEILMKSLLRFEGILMVSMKPFKQQKEAYNATRRAGPAQALLDRGDDGR
jgi:hypothetical protein